MALALLGEIRLPSWPSISPAGQGKAHRPRRTETATREPIKAQRMVRQRTAFTFLGQLRFYSKWCEKTWLTGSDQRAASGVGLGGERKQPLSWHHHGTQCKSARPVHQDMHNSCPTNKYWFSAKRCSCLCHRCSVFGRCSPHVTCIHPRCNARMRTRDHDQHESHVPKSEGRLDSE